MKWIKPFFKHLLAALIIALGVGGYTAAILALTFAMFCHFTYVCYSDLYLELKLTILTLIVLFELLGGAYLMKWSRDLVDKVLKFLY